MRNVVNKRGSRRSGDVPAWIDRRVLLVLGLLATLVVAGYAAAPAWWAARGLPNGQAASDYAAANQGQLKNMAKAARAELVAQGHFQLTDTHAINTLVDGWSANNENATDYAAANLGQLKAVARLFYDALYLDYPWPAASPAANDYAVANIGQLKTVFAFQVGPCDSDADGLPDGWERKMFGDLDQGAGDDFDQDGLTDSQEFALGTSPKLQDTDADGMPDAWEQQYSLNPRDPSDAGPAQGRVVRPEEPLLPQSEDYTHDYGNGPVFDSGTFNGAMDSYQAAMTAHGTIIHAADRIDVDKEGLSNLREYLAGTNPRAASSDADLYSDYEELAYGSDPLVAASIPPVRVEFSNAGPSLLKVSTFRAERSVGGEAVTVVGAPDTQFFSTAPGGVLTPGEITVTTDAVQHFATVWVFAPKGVAGGRNETVTTEDNLTGNGNGNSQTGNSHTLASNEWRGSLAQSLDPTLPGPTPNSPPPPEGILFTAHRIRSLGYSARQGVQVQTVPDGSPAQTFTEWYKSAPPGPRPPYSDDGFNGDADLQGENEDPGDPRDDISWSSGGAVSASSDEEFAYPVSTGGEIPMRVVGPYGAPGPMEGSYTATNGYSPPDKIESNGNGGFNYEAAAGKLASVSYFRGGNANGWQGNGPQGVKAYTVTSTFTQGTEAAPPVAYEDQTGQPMVTTATYGTQGASMEQVEVRLQTNKEVEEGEPVSMVFLLTKSTVEGQTTTSELLATFKLSINVGKVSDAFELLSGALPANDVTSLGGVVSMRSPPPEAGKAISYDLVPMEVMQHPVDVTDGSSDPPAAQSLRLCRWLDAYDASGNLATNYPREDRDRIRIKIPAAPFPGQDKITVKIATKKPAGTNDPEDAATDLECDKIGDSFISKPIILVGDGFRAGNGGDDTWSQVSPQDEQTNDPTHVASPGGKVEIELPLPGNVKIEFPIAKYTSKVKVQTYVVRSPSSDARVHPNILTFLSDGVQRAKDIYKQAHIKIEHQGPYDCLLTDAELDLINSDRGDGERTLLMNGGNTNNLEDGESQFVFDKIRALDGGGTDFVRIIYVDCDYVGRNPRTVAVTMRDLLGIGNGNGGSKYGVYEGFIVIPIKNASDINLPPHESGHALKMLHPKDEAIWDGVNPALIPELPYMLMDRASTSVWDESAKRWLWDEYSAKRFVKKDLDKLKASPTPLFIITIP